MSVPDCSILVNGEPASVPSGCTVELLLSQLDMTRRRVAVALNRDIVPRTAYPATQLRPGDQIEILEAVGGG